jgi:hypothetical protein
VVARVERDGALERPAGLREGVREAPRHRPHRRLAARRVGAGGAQRRGEQLLLRLAAVVPRVAEPVPAVGRHRVGGDHGRVAGARAVEQRRGRGEAATLGAGAERPRQRQVGGHEGALPRREPLRVGARVREVGEVRRVAAVVPPAGQRPLVPRERERRVLRHRAAEQRVGALQPPRVERPHPVHVRPVGGERRGGVAREVDGHVGRAGHVEQVARDGVEQRPRVAGARGAVLRLVELAPRGHVVERGHHEQRVAGALHAPRDHRPRPGAAGERPRVVEREAARLVELEVAQQVERALVVGHAHVLPLREVEREHVDAPLAQPLELRVGAQHVERRHRERPPRVDARRRAVAGAPRGRVAADGDERRRHRRRHGQPAPPTGGRRGRPGPPRSRAHARRGGGGRRARPDGPGGAGPPPPAPACRLR